MERRNKSNEKISVNHRFHSQLMATLDQRGVVVDVNDEDNMPHVVKQAILVRYQNGGYLAVEEASSPLSIRGFERIEADATDLIVVTLAEADGFMVEGYIASETTTAKISDALYPMEEYEVEELATSLGFEGFCPYPDE